MVGTKNGVSEFDKTVPFAIKPVATPVMKLVISSPKATVGTTTLQMELAKKPLPFSGIRLEISRARFAALTTFYASRRKPTLVGITAKHRCGVGATATRLTKGCFEIAAPVGKPNLAGASPTALSDAIPTPTAVDVNAVVYGIFVLAGVDGVPKPTRATVSVTVTFVTQLPTGRYTITTDVGGQKIPISVLMAVMVIGSGFEGKLTTTTEPIHDGVHKSLSPCLVMGYVSKREPTVSDKAIIAITVIFRLPNSFVISLNALTQGIGTFVLPNVRVIPFVVLVTT